MSNEIQIKSRIFGLDVLRSIAILSVVFSHGYYWLGLKNPLLLSISGLFGFIGVEIFFVLSGFLIGTILLKNFIKDEFTFSDVKIFLKRRWFRTLPNYFLVLLLNFGIALSFGFSLQNTWKYFFFFQNFSSNGITFFSESWSLSVEEWTYIFAAICFFISAKVFKSNKKKGFLLITILVICFVHFLRWMKFQLAPIYDLTIWNTDIKAIVVYRIDSIFYGFLVAWIAYFYSHLLKKYSFYLIVIAAYLFLFQFVVLNVLDVTIVTKPVFYHVFYFTLTSVTIALSLPFFIQWNSTAFFVKPITYISKISYSIYLLHYSIIGFLFKFVVDTYQIKLAAVYLIIIYLLITFLMSHVLYSFYEKPLTNLRDKTNSN